MKKYTKRNNYLVLFIVIGLSLCISQIQGVQLFQDGQYVFYGDEANASLGRIVKGVGDVNDDGFDDYAISAPFHDYQGMLSAGAVYLFFGEEDASMVDLTINDADAIFYGEEEGDNAGNSLSSAGDVNGDGFDDFLIGSPNQGDNFEGRVYLIFGRPTVAWTYVNELGTVGTSFYGETSISFLGTRVDGANHEPIAGIGDIDNDGFDDIALGAGIYDIPFLNVGQLYIFYGSSTLSGNINVSSADLIIHGDKDLDIFGSVAGLGDINSDGYDDYAAGSYGYDMTELNDLAGAIYLMYGGPTRTTGYHNITSVYDALIYGEQLGSQLGRSIFSIGDHNGDGTVDFAVSADAYNSNDGALYVFYGKEYSGELNATIADKKFYGDPVSTRFGTIAVEVADINGDGLPEIAISDYNYDGTYGNQGRVNIYFGSNDNATYGPSDSNMTIGWEYGRPNTYFGIGLANAGDVNGDDNIDLIFGASNYYNGTHVIGASILTTKIFTNQKFTEVITFTETAPVVTVVETAPMDIGEYLTDLPVTTYAIAGGSLLAFVVLMILIKKKK